MESEALLFEKTYENLFTVCCLSWWEGKREDLLLLQNRWNLMFLRRKTHNLFFEMLKMSDMSFRTEAHVYNMSFRTEAHVYNMSFRGEVEAY